MGAAAELANESQRLTTLMCLRILDTPHEERFDRTTRVVAAHFGVTIAAINLIDAERQWSKAEVGLGVSELPRAISFCARVVLVDDAVSVPETLADPRFFDNPLVTYPLPTSLRMALQSHPPTAKNRVLRPPGQTRWSASVRVKPTRRARPSQKTCG